MVTSTVWRREGAQCTPCLGRSLSGCGGRILHVPFLADCSLRKFGPGVELLSREVVLCGWKRMLTARHNRHGCVRCMRGLLGTRPTTFASQKNARMMEKVAERDREQRSPNHDYRFQRRDAGAWVASRKEFNGDCAGRRFQDITGPAEPPSIQ